METRTRTSRRTAEVEPETRTSRGPAINRVTLLGRLTHDPEVREVGDGGHRASLRIATNEREEPEFHSVVAWNRLAEVCGEYLRKGSLVYVEGSLRTRQAEEKRITEVRADAVQFLEKAA